MKYALPLNALLTNILLYINIVYRLIGILIYLRVQSFEHPISHKSYSEAPRPYGRGIFIFFVAKIKTDYCQYRREKLEGNVSIRYTGNGMAVVFDFWQAPALHSITPLQNYIQGYFILL